MIQCNPSSSSSLLTGTCKRTQPRTLPPVVPSCWLLLCHMVLNKKQNVFRYATINLSDLTSVNWWPHLIPCPTASFLPDFFHFYPPLWNLSSKYFVAYSCFFCWHFTSIWDGFFLSHLFVVQSEIKSTEVCLLNYLSMWTEMDDAHFSLKPFAAPAAHVLSTLTTLLSVSLIPAIRRPSSLASSRMQHVYHFLLHWVFWSDFFIPRVRN